MNKSNVPGRMQETSLGRAGCKRRAWAGPDARDELGPGRIGPELDESTTRSHGRRQQQRGSSNEAGAPRHELGTESDGDSVKPFDVLTRFRKASDEVWSP